MDPIGSDQIRSDPIVGLILLGLNQRCEKLSIKKKSYPDCIYHSLKDEEK